MNTLQKRNLMILNLQIINDFYTKLSNDLFNFWLGSNLYIRFFIKHLFFCSCSNTEYFHFNFFVAIEMFSFLFFRSSYGNTVKNFDKNNLHAKYYNKNKYIFQFNNVGSKPLSKILKITKKDDMAWLYVCGLDDVEKNKRTYTYVGFVQI
jgi:hypothetical protein